MEPSYKEPIQSALLIQQDAQLHSPVSLNYFLEYLRCSPHGSFAHSLQRVLPLNFSSLSTRVPNGPVVCLPSAPSSSNEPEILLKAISCGNCSRIKWEQEATVQHCLATCCWSPVTSHPCPPPRLPGRAGEGSVPSADSQPGSKAQSGPSPPGEALQPISDNCRAAGPRCHLRPRRRA